jgi:hypothetical protein
MTWSPAWAWLVLAVIVVAFVVVFDVHAYFAHTATMSGQFRTWIFNPSLGPVVFGLWVGLFTGLTFHWFEYKGR